MEIFAVYRFVPLTQEKAHRFIHFESLSRFVSMSAEEAMVGFGYRSPFTIDLPFERVWAAMIDKVYHTGKYLPVINVKTEERPTHVYREMTMISPSQNANYSDGRIYKQEIYLDKDNAEMRFVCVDVDEVHINKYHKDEKVLEYYAMNKKDERQFWNAPQSYVYHAMLMIRDEAFANGSSK